MHTRTKIEPRSKLPDNYKRRLDLRETERAIKFIKDHFQLHLSRALNLSRISAPMFVLQKSGINDYLNSVERPVSFLAKDMHETAEIVQSLAKWKRCALADYGFREGEGLYTDMNAVRPDERLDNLHSLYVDQWDWEIVMRGADRNLDFLQEIVRRIYKVIRQTEMAACRRYDVLGGPTMPEKIHFIHSEDIVRRFPSFTPWQREDEICREFGAVFITGIGMTLADGQPHDGRAADYDDWSTATKGSRHGLNGDILVWNPILNHAFELSSMGIRVDGPALLRQLELRGERVQKGRSFHRRLLKGELPQTIGGGIGQSRLCMFYLRKAHIGEVQSSIWPQKIIEECAKKGIKLL